VGTGTEPRVLVVDDDMEGRIALGELLTLWGYEVVAADDGTHAIEVTVAKRPDIVVLDLGLANRSGVELVPQLRAEGAFVIAYSGWRTLEADARAAGAGAFVLKPDLLALERALAAADVARSESAATRKKSNADTR
jgi:two-component system KDP operon response regulator KdpE